MLKEVRLVHPSETPPRCSCGQAFTRVAVHTDGTHRFYFCPSCDEPEHRKNKQQRS